MNKQHLPAYSQYKINDLFMNITWQKFCLRRPGPIGKFKHYFNAFHTQHTRFYLLAIKNSPWWYKLQTFLVTFVNTSTGNKFYLYFCYFVYFLLISIGLWKKAFQFDKCFLSFYCTYSDCVLSISSSRPFLKLNCWCNNVWKYF